MTKQEIIDSVLEERKSQTSKWGNPHRPNGDWFKIFAEEFGEVAECIVNLEVPPITDKQLEFKIELRKEIIQCMAVCMSWLEDFDKDEI